MLIDHRTKGLTDCYTDEMNNPVYIFDVDGVLNNILDYEVDKRVIGQIAAILNNDCYVAINTGRGYTSVKEKVIDGVRAHIADNKLDRIFVSTEMGGVTVEFSNGVEQDSRTAFSLMPEQIDQVKKVYDANAADKNIAWYKGKVSMATIYKPADAEPALFLQTAQRISTELQDLFVNHHVRIIVNPDALDVITPEAGKWAGAQLIHDWLQRTPAANTTHYICFGDNASDYEMARFFGQQGHTVDFIFTGEALGEIEHDSQVTITKTPIPFSDGTYEFLKTVAASN